MGDPNARKSKFSRYINIRNQKSALFFLKRHAIQAQLFEELYPFWSKKQAWIREEIPIKKILPHYM